MSRSAERAVIILLFVIVVLVEYNRDRKSIVEYNRDLKSMNVQLATTTGSAKSLKAANTLHYHRHAERFTTILADCILDDSCRLLFNHVGKTGGTTVEEQFFKMMPPRITDPGLNAREIQKTTHNMPLFEKYPHAFCEQAKFTSYQGSTFQAIAQRCLEIATTRRFVLLTAYREPIARTLSYVHQTCNKNLERRGRQTLEACRRCKYNDNNADALDEASRRDKEFWDGFVNITNTQYSVLLDFHKHLKEDLKPTSRNQTIDVLMLDTSDLNKFFHQLDEALVAAQTNRTSRMVRVPSQKASSNKEELEVCSFGLKSPMIKGLKTAVAVYRELTLAM